MPDVSVVVLALVLGLAVGLVLGSLGGGGAVLAVPVLVLVLGQPADVATTVSLLVVLVAACSGLLSLRGMGRVDWRVGGVFGGLGVVGAAVGARLSVDVPEQVLLTAFAVLVLVVAVVTWRGAEGSRTSGVRRRSISLKRAVPTATGAGLLTGFFGVGGGFVTVPALATVIGLTAARATATSLVVIAINALVALVVRGYVLGLDGIPVALAVIFAAATGVGAAIGARGASRLRDAHLLKGFAVLLAVVGTAMLLS